MEAVYESVYTNYDVWAEEHKPVPSSEDARFDGCMFETFGDDLFRVMQADTDKVWSVIEDDNGNECVITGMHVVNIVGYLITTKAWKDGDDWNIYDSDVIEEMERVATRSVSGYVVDRVVPKRTKGLKRHNYGKNDHRNEPNDTPLNVLWWDEKKGYVLQYHDGDENLLFTNECYDTPQEAVDHAWVAFGAKVYNTHAGSWIGDDEDLFED
jgi:hypothetical protein